MKDNDLKIYLKVKIAEANEKIIEISENKIGPYEYDTLVRLMERKDTLNEIFNLLKRNNII